MAVELFEHLYMIDGGVREFFIIGKDHVLLIDTGFGNIDLMSEIRKYTDLPVQVLLTHGHPDHTGGANQFAEVYLHPRDFHMYDGKKKEMPDHYDIGEYSFEIIEIPGHTHGSVALYDQNKKLLIGGDSIQEGPIYMFSQDANLEEYEQSLNKLLALEIDTVLASHHTCILPGKYIQYCLDDLHRYLRGELSPVKHQKPDCLLYTGKNVSFFL